MKLEMLKFLRLLSSFTYLCKIKTKNMTDYVLNRINWYVDRLRDLKFYVSRKSEKNNVITYYLISATDWRHTVIISCHDNSCFRLDILYVNSLNSYHFTENDFDNLLTRIKRDIF